jgi:tetratricopeptide (TPR) repeat protein
MNLMQFAIEHFSNHRKKYFGILFLVFLISLNLFLSVEYRSNFPLDVMSSDDLVHIEIADSFRTEKNFHQSYISTRLTTNSAEEIINIKACLECPQGSKGPVYYILLGSVYEILSTSGNELFFHASYFNNILSIIFLSLFFIFTYKKFGFIIASISSTSIALIAIIKFNSVFIRIDPLLHIFMILSLFFLERKKSHYVIFGILSGLAHLTHPIGATLIASYLIFLLIKREFKGFLITFVVWIMVLTPWMIRNFNEFSNIGKGLYIPFSQQISNIILTIFPNTTSFVSGADQAGRIGFTSNTNIIELVNSSERLFNNYLGSEYFIIFLIIFAPIAYISFNKIKSRIVYLAGITLGGFGIYYYIFNLQFSESILQILFILIIPPVILVIISKWKRNVFRENIPRFQNFFILYFFIHFVAILQFTGASQEWQSLEIRFFFFHIFLILPIALFGFKELMKNIFRKRGIKEKIIIGIIVGLIFFPLANELVESHEYIDRFSMWTETDEMKEIHQLIKKDNKAKTIASNYADISWFKTGLNSISLPNYVESQENFEEYLKYYNISHLVFYNNDLEPRYVDDLSVIRILEWIPNEFGYEKFDFKDSTVLKIIKIIDADISTPDHYVTKMVLLENTGNIPESKKAYEELMNTEFRENDLEKLCKAFYKHDYLKEVINKCKELYENDDTILKIRNIEEPKLQSSSFTVENWITIKIAEETIKRYENKITGIGYTSQNDPPYEQERNMTLDEYGKLHPMVMNHYFENQIKIKKLEQFSQNDPLYEQERNMILDEYGKLYLNEAEYLLAVKMLIKINENDQLIKESSPFTVEYLMKNDRVEEAKELTVIQNKINENFMLIVYDVFELEKQKFTKNMNELVEVEKYEEKLNAYDKMIKMYYQYIEALRNTNDHEEANNKNKELLNIMFNKTDILTELEKDNKIIIKHYTEMVSINKFNPMIYEKIAEYYEKKGSAQLAINNYQTALKLDPTNNYLIEKIEELSRVK